VTTSALSAALGADTSHVACFGRDGQQYRWLDLVAAASRVSAAVDQAAGQRWAVNLDGTFEFAAALLGCWAAGKTPVLAPRPLLENDDSLSIDGVIQSAESATKARTRIIWEHLADTRQRIREIAPTSELVLYTSGSTGTPKEVCRSVRNVEAELAVLESLWGERIGSCSVYSTVSHRHVYGMLFRVLWPLLNRRPLATFDLEYPEQLIGGSRMGHVLISSPALLKRIGHLADCAGGWRAVFSSGGLLPSDAAADAMRVLGACPVEVLGSTETSGVAWRQQLSRDATSWKAMPTVEIRAGADELLEVCSPFTGQSGWLQMGDMIRMADDGSFDLLGRGDHLAKIEDKRVSLAEIEHYLLQSPWVQDAAAVGLDDGARQYVGVVLQLSDAGASELQRCGRRAFNELLKRSLRTKIEPIALPRKFRYLDEIPVDPQGKRQQTKLRELFQPQ
jgi:acyl-coenzyme A synthetase/AMP-(fatty) acid ligase